MTFEILTTPANSPASLLFQQCLVEIVPDNKLMNMAKEEIAGYFLAKIEPTAVSEDLWMKVLNNSQIKKNLRLTYLLILFLINCLNHSKYTWLIKKLNGNLLRM